MLQTMVKVEDIPYSVQIEAIRNKCVVKCTRQNITQRFEIWLKQALDHMGLESTNKITPTKASSLLNLIQAEPPLGRNQKLVFTLPSAAQGSVDPVDPSV